MTDTEPIALVKGSIAWLPRRSRPEFRAHATGLAYFTVHQRRPGISIGKAPTHDDQASAES